MADPVVQDLGGSCPNCGSATAIECLGKRYALYPLGCVHVLALPLATAHQLSAPVDFRCNACGHEFGRRTVLGKVGLAVIGLFLLSLVAAAVAGFVWVVIESQG